MKHCKLYLAMNSNYIWLASVGRFPVSIYSKMSMDNYNGILLIKYLENVVVFLIFSIFLNKQEMRKSLSV